MSDPNGDQQEPSMEEILASIRRIISEDDEEAGAEASGAAADEDVLELTDVVDSGELEGGPDFGSGSGEDEPDGDEAGNDEAAEDEAAEDEPEDREQALAEDEPEDASAVGEDAPLAAGEDDDRLISEDTEIQSTATMAGLAAALAAHAPLGDSQKTLEALVKELMRPMLKEWLDANLPDLVERVVREEVERISKKAR